MFTVFHLLLIIIHFLYNLFATVYNISVIFHRKCIELWYGNNFTRDIDILTRTASKMKKLPRHIIVIFGAKEDTVLDCVQIIGWCITLGIPYISFVDITGFLVRNENALKYEFAKERPELTEYISWSKPSTGVVQNGVTNSKLKTRVMLLSSMDGKEEIVSLTKSLAEAVLLGTIKPEEIDANLLDEKLNPRAIPDPDLGVIYGNICCTYGALPWQTRITEFFILPLYLSSSVKDFAYVLEKYSKCEQRFGK